jgi:hypothetical protein
MLGGLRASIAGFSDSDYGLWWGSFDSRWPVQRYELGFASRGGDVLVLLVPPVHWSDAQIQHHEEKERVLIEPW